MQIEERFIGRDREVAQLELSIGPGRDGLRLAMLSGPSGLGKTTLSRVAARAAAARGFRVATVNGRAGSLSTPFAPFMEAMPEFEVLLSVLAGDQSIDIEHAGIGLVNLLAELTINEPLLIVFDDAQALDESSIALLPYLVGVSERMDITLFFVEQTDAIDVPSSYRSFIDGVLARRVVNHLELGPMADDAVRELVAHVLAVEEPTEVPAEIVLRSGGNPWFAKELAESYRRGDSEIPTNIAAAATARLHSLDETGQDVVYAVSICPEGAHIGWLEAISGQRPRQFVRVMEAIEQSGLIREDGDIITIAHPLMQQALVDELSAAMRRAIHVELAEVIADVPMAEVVAARAQGFHLAQAGRTNDAVEHYLRAAEANEVHGQLHEAYADLRHALASEPRIEGRIDLLKRCAGMAMQLGHAAAIDHWTELGRVSAANGDDEVYAYSLCQQYWASGDGTMLERLQRAASLGPDRVGWSARAASCLAMLDGRFDDVAELDGRALKIARERGDKVLEAMSLQGSAVGHDHRGNLETAIELFTEAIAVGIRERLHGVVVASWYGLAESLLGNLEGVRALKEAQAAVRYVEDLGLDKQRPVLLTQVGRLQMYCGALEQARATAIDARAAQAAGGLERYAPVVQLFSAQIEIEVGDLVHAAEELEVARTMVGRQQFPPWHLDAAIEHARYLLRAGRFDEAIAVTSELEIDENLGAGLLAVTFARAGVLHGVPALVAEAQRFVPAGTTESLVRLCVEEVHALAGSNVASLKTVADRWVESGRLLDAARVQLVLASLLAASGERDAAVELFKSTQRTFIGIGAAPDADVAAARLRALGTRSRARSRTSNVGELTKRELEIARLVASGLRNAEVAAQLFLSEKTIAAHLSNIYGKIEVRSRVKLTAWIRENDTEFSASVAS